jgi:hypothetical protein
MTRYWVASRSRVDRWRGQLDRGGRNRSATAGKRKYCWPTAEIVAEEFLLADVLARVWAGWLQHTDCPIELRPWANVAAAVIRDHDELRTQILRMLMTHDAFGSLRQTARLNNLRWRAQRWTDLLLRSLGGMAGDEPGVQDGSEPVDLASAQPRDAEAAARGVSDALRHQFPRTWQCRAANPDLNRAVAIAVVRGLARPRAPEMGSVGSDLWVVGITTTMDVLLEAVEPGDAPRDPAARPSFPK